MNILKKPKENVKPPYVKYLFINKQVWEDFVESRGTPELLAKSQKGEWS